MTLKEAFDDFEIDELVSEDRSPDTIANYRKACNSLLRSVGADIPVELLSYAHIIKWKKQMHDDGLALSYMAQLLRHLRIVLTYLRKHSFAVLDPAEIKLPKFKYRETAWLTLDELKRFLSVIESPRDRALFGCLFGAGARYHELLQLNRDSIVDGRAKVRGKGKKAQDEPDILEFDDNALWLIDEYLKTRTDDCEALFISRQQRRLSIQQAEKLCHKYAELAEIGKNVTTHVFRHSFGTNLNINGLDIYGVSKQLRHANIDTTRIYIHGADLRKRSDYEKFHTPTPIT